MDPGAQVKQPSRPGRLARRFAGGARRLHDDEGGAAMIFAAITLFSLALAVFMVFQVGLVSTDRMQIQSSADAAAYSGAQVEANALNSIGQLNDGMAYVHYATLRYVLDNIVYGTLHAFETHPQWLRSNDTRNLLAQTPPGATSGGLATEYGRGIENAPAPGWVMLGDEGEWRRRWGAVENKGKQAVEEGKRWLLQLDAANHLILEKTPEMVRQKAAEVAFLNGASHVAISSDLEQAFRSNRDGRDEVGFIAAVGEGQGAVASALPYRYETRALKVDGKPRKLSTISWFDPLTGRSRGDGYWQLRVCWNKNDWAHRSSSDMHLGFPPQWSRAPNGHWHARHKHQWIEFDANGFPKYEQRDHGGLTGGGSSVREASTGGGFGGGHMMPTDDDPGLHLLVQMGGAMAGDPNAMNPHHATVLCPTCMNDDGVGGAQFSQLHKRQARADASRLAMELTFDGSDFPRPLLVTQALLRSGVTVAAWRESHGIGDLLPKSDWGMIALAAAQVGLMDPQGRVFALDSASSGKYGPGEGMEVPLGDLNRGPYRNLFYSTDYSGGAEHPGVRFGARLVPLRREESHHPKLHRSGAVAELLRPGSGRWWTTTNPQQPGESNMTQEAPASLGALRQWVVFDDFRHLQEVVWH